MDLRLLLTLRDFEKFKGGGGRELPFLEINLLKEIQPL